IMRLEPETSGRVRFDGTDITHLSGRALQPFRRRFQMVFQDSTASLNPRKTVSRVLGESLALAAVPRGEREAFAEHAAHGLARIERCGAVLEHHLEAAAKRLQGAAAQLRDVGAVEAHAAA